MKGRLIRGIALATLLVAAAGLLSGCFAFRRVESTPARLRTETKTVPKDDASELDARFRMPVGILNVDNATTDLAEMEFTSTNPDWLPVVSSTSSQAATGTVAELDVVVPDRVRLGFGDTRYEWDVHLAPDVASLLQFDLGAGESDLDLREMDVRQLNVNTGVGETTIDLSGPRESDLTAEIQCGIGVVTIRVPEDVGVRISGREGGIGSLSADGFTLSGNDLVNAAWTTSPVKIEIDLHRGIGEIKIESVR